MNQDNFKEFMQAEQYEVEITERTSILKTIGLDILYITVGGIQLALLIGFISLFFYYPLPMLALTIFIGIFFNPLRKSIR